jgi:hypothetical protein
MAGLLGEFSLFPRVISMPHIDWARMEGIDPTSRKTHSASTLILNGVGALPETCLTKHPLI